MDSGLILLGPSSVLTIALPAELVVKAARGQRFVIKGEELGEYALPLERDSFSNDESPAALRSAPFFVPCWRASNIFPMTPKGTPSDGSQSPRSCKRRR